MAIALLPKLPLVPVDYLAAEPPRELRFHLGLLAGAVFIGLLLQILGPSWARDILAQVQLFSLGGAAALLLALLLSVLAHELGHLGAALFLNYQVLGGSLGPLRIELWNHKIFFRYQKGNFFRCSVSAVPREIQNAWRTRMLWVISAGPAFSLLFLIAAARVATTGNVAEPDQSWALTFWSACAEINFFLFMLGLVPNQRTALVRNDAALFQSVWKKDSDARDLFMCHQATELTFRGIRPEDYPEPLLGELANFFGRPYTTLVTARRVIEWATDSGNTDLAGEWDHYALNTSRAFCSPQLVNTALAESACFDVLFRDDMRSALHKFGQVDFSSLFPPSLAERAWAARLIACDLPARAPAHILRAQYHLPLGNPFYNYERRLLDKLHTKALSLSQPVKAIAASAG